MLALPRGELQHATATCWQSPHTTEPRNLGLPANPSAPTPPLSVLPFSSLSSTIPPSLNQFLLMILPPHSSPHPAKLCHLFPMPASFSFHPSVPVRQHPAPPPGCLQLESHITPPNAKQINKSRHAPAFSLRGATCCCFTCVVPSPSSQTTHMQSGSEIAPR